MHYPRAVTSAGDWVRVGARDVDYTSEERVAICMESGIPEQEARLIAARDAAIKRRLELGLPARADHGGYEECAAWKQRKAKRQKNYCAGW